MKKRTFGLGEPSPGPKVRFFQKDFPSAPKLLGHSRDPTRCPKRPRAPPYHVNLHLNSPNRVLDPFPPLGAPGAAHAHVNGTVSGPTGWNPRRDIPWGRQTRGRAFGAPLGPGVQRPNQGCRVFHQSAARASRGEQALTNPGQQVEPAAWPEVGGPICPQIPPRAALGHACLLISTYVKRICVS